MDPWEKSKAWMEKMMPIMLTDAFKEVAMNPDNLCSCTAVKVTPMNGRGEGMTIDDLIFMARVVSRLKRMVFVKATSDKKAYV